MKNIKIYKNVVEKSVSTSSKINRNSISSSGSRKLISDSEQQWRDDHLEWGTYSQTNQRCYIKKVTNAAMCLIFPAKIATSKEVSDWVVLFIRDRNKSRKKKKITTEYFVEEIAVQLSWDETRWESFCILFIILENTECHDK